jgi:hypothetical protein
MMISFSSELTISNVDLSMSTTELQEQPPSRPVGAIGTASDMAKNDDGLSDLFEGSDSDEIAENDDGFSDLFEGSESNVTTYIDEVNAYIDANPPSPKASPNPTVQGASVLSEPIANQASQNSIDAAISAQQGKTMAKASKRLYVESTLPLSAGTTSAPARGAWTDQVPADFADRQASSPEQHRTLVNFSQAPRVNGSEFRAAPVSVSHPAHNYHQGFKNPRIAPSATQAESIAPQAPTAPQSQVSQSLTQWTAFADARSARLWMMRAETGPLAASLLDNTIPRTIGQKRAVANRIRAGFSSAQPPTTEAEFILLDWTCLELVDEVCLAHYYGSLTQRYLIGMPKQGPATFDTYAKHIDALVQVIGTRNCAQATNLRKRLIEVTHRKRLIDNPIAELETIQKNVTANATRKSKNEKRKAKAARAEAAEVELAKLKSESDAQSLPAARNTIMPSRPSAKLSSTRGASFPAGSFQRPPMTPPSTFEFSPDDFDKDMNFDSDLDFDFGIGDKRPSTTSYGQPAAKKADVGNHRLMSLPQTPTPMSTATVGFNVGRVGGHRKPQAGQMNGRAAAGKTHGYGPVQQVTQIQQPYDPSATKALSRFVPETWPSDSEFPSMLPPPADVPPGLPIVHNPDFMHNYRILLSGLTFEQMDEAGRLGMDLNE